MDDQKNPRPMENGGGRRKFLQVVIATFSALIGLALGIPFIGALLGPASRAKRGSFSDVAALDSIPLGKPVDLAFSVSSADAFIQQDTVRHVWVYRRSASEVAVFSPICPHLGCRYDWDAQSSRFMCPCHGSVYTIDGRVVAGPAPRPLDTLPAEIRQGRLFVEWEQFKVGIRQKVSV
jgi:menaquinol-cytochrome c reductase iron-sulfur subunit